MSCTPTMHEKTVFVKAYDLDRGTYRIERMCARCECFVLYDYQDARMARAKKLREGAK